MNRWILALLLAAQMPVTAAEVLPTGCDAPPAVGELRDFICAITASATRQHFRFKANFSGGHDDTLASMAPTLDGAPLACDAGSKTRLMGEDGEVSLECKFSIPPGAGTRHHLMVALRWSHAQYTDVEFGPDPRP